MSDNYAIDSHKLMLHPSRVHQWLEAEGNWEKAKKIYPLYVEISPYGGCNHRCDFCALDFMGYKNIAIDIDIMKKMFDSMANKGVKSVMFAGEGEPLLHPHLDQAVEYATQLGIDTSLTTNFVPFKEKKIEVFVRDCKWIKVSLNAGSRQNYAKIHQTQEEDYDRVIENLQKAVALKKEHDYSCTIGIQMVLLPENKDEAVSLAKTAKSIGVDYLVIKPYSNHPQSLQNREIDYKSLVSIKKELDAIDFNVIFRINAIEKEITQKSNYKRCYSTPYFWGYVSSNGDVYGCSVYLTDDKFCYGNINENSFEAIWESDKRKKSLEFVSNELDISECRVNCRMNNINEYLWRLRHPQDHDNFI